MASSTHTSGSLPCGQPRPPTSVTVGYPSARSDSTLYRSGELLESVYDDRSEKTQAKLHFIDEDEGVLVSVHIEAYDSDLDEYFGTVWQVSRKRLLGESGDLTREEIEAATDGFRLWNGEIHSARYTLGELSEVNQ